MKEIDTTFFQGKRPWSKIKDKVLSGYMPPYLSKVKKLGRPILLIDGYAGPGVFTDGGTGSPLIMCEAAEQHVPDKYQAIFVNYNRKHHQTLEDVLIEKGWRHKATPILGDSTAFLAQLSEALSDQTLFVYLDPFGLKGCEFSTLEPLLTRSKTFSTEIVLNISMPITHRLASANKVAMGKADDPRIVSYHQRMTAVFGGDYWKDIYFSDLTAEDKEFALIQDYQQRIARYLPYTGSCPVREDSKSRVKYFIMFASRHPDAMLLMNNEMCKAYFKQMHEADFTGSLFEQFDWQDFRSPQRLREIVQEEIRLNPGQTRMQIWHSIVSKYFMQFTEKEYRQSVKYLSGKKQIRVEYTKTGKLNDLCRLHPSL